MWRNFWRHVLLSPSNIFFAVLLNDYKLSCIVIKSISITRRNVRVPKKDKIETETDVEFVVSWKTLNV